MLVLAREWRFESSQPHQLFQQLSDMAVKVVSLYFLARGQISMRHISPYVVLGYYILAPMPLAGTVAGWFVIRSIEGWEAGWAAAAIVPGILVFSAVIVVVGIVLLILLKRAEMPVGRMIIALLVAAVPLVGYSILRVTL